jgi:hypothetical protein
MAVGYSSEDQKKISLLKDQGINGRTILKWVSKKRGARMWTGSCNHGNEPIISIRGKGFLTSEANMSFSRTLGTPNKLKTQHLLSATFIKKHFSNMNEQLCLYIKTVLGKNNKISWWEKVLSSSWISMHGHQH